MKRKIFSIFFTLVLVLSFSLVTAAPVAAQETLNVSPPELWQTTGATVEWSTEQAKSGSYSVHLTTTGAVGNGYEALVRIPLPEGTTLADIETISWWEYNIAGYPPHVDIRVDTDGNGTADDALVFEYAYNNMLHYAEAPMPYGALTGAWYQTFSDDGNGPSVIDDTANAWLSSGASGPPGDTSFISGTLAQWKAGTVDASVSGSTAITALEIEVDNWVVQSEAYVDDLAINGVVYYGLIQDAIDSAFSGDTISVAAGTYTEDVDVNVEGITIQGESLDAIVDGGFALLVDDITIDGLTIKNGRPGPLAAYHPAAISVEGESDGHTIINNTLIGNGSVPSNGILLCKLNDDIIIDGNVVYNWRRGITLRSLCDNVTISNNEVYDNLVEGIGLGDSTNCVVTDNDIYGNNILVDTMGGGGISVYKGSGHVINFNDIYDNFHSGLSNYITTNLNATLNWWGDASGPGPVGLGNSVICDGGEVASYSPWLGQSKDAAHPWIFCVDDVGTVPAAGYIQTAINGASAGDTIIVAAGIYVEDLDIPATKTNLELVGNDATIKGVANVPQPSWPLGIPNIEILADGVKIHGFTIQGPDYEAGYYASGIILDGTGIEIYDNDFVTTPAETAGEIAHAITTISKEVEGFGTADVSGLYIHDNTFTGSGAVGSEFIYINPHTGSGTITIDTNQFSGSTNMGITVESGNTIVNNNTISSNLGHDTPPYGTYGIRFMDTTYSGIYNDIVISDNNIQGFKRAIRVGNGGAGDSVFTAVISSNTLINNGIGVWGRLGNHLTVVGNSIAGNGVGVQNGDDTVTINAENNWWGNAAGPTHEDNTFNVSDQGNAVSGLVDFVPWLDTDMTGTSFAPVENADTGDQYSSIQTAINGASAGETISVAAGTYTEDVDVNVEGITIESVSGAGSTTIDSVSAGSVIAINAAGVTIGGTDKGFKIEGEGAVADGLIYIGANDTTITENQFVGDYYLMVLDSGVSGVTVEDNTFLTHSSIGANEVLGVYVSKDVTGSTFDGNSFPLGSGPTQHVDSGIYMETGTTAAQNITISNNTFEGMGKRVYSSAQMGCAAIELGGVGGITIESNTIQNNSDGIWFEGEVLTGTVTILKNTITGNVWGISLLDGVGTEGSITINYNNITGNTEKGIDNDNEETDAIVDAQYNWWGDVAGPVHTDSDYCNPYQLWSLGDTVSGNMDYIPWLIHTELASGWNIYSTPIALDSSCTTISDALDIWTADSGNLDIAYYFNSSASPQAFDEVTSLTPLEAVYVKMNAAATMDVFFSTNATPPPQRHLYTGWNLVGPAQLYNVDVYDALLSAYYGTGVAAGLWGYTQAISPALNDIYWQYLREGNPGFRDFVPTRGYWVYMVNQGGLAGSTSTPIIEVIMFPD